PLFQLVPAVNDVIVLERRASIGRVSSWRSLGAELTDRRFDTALLLPNSIHAALIASRAAIPQRWGYGTSWRSRMLTRAVSAPAGLHQVEYYQRLVAALGFPNGSSEPGVAVGADVRDRAAAMLAR